MRILREAAGVAYRAAKLVVAKGVDLVTGPRGGTPRQDPVAKQDSGSKISARECWSAARSKVDDVFRYQTDLNSCHFAACAVFCVDEHVMKLDLILNRYLFKNKPSREETERFQRILMSLLDDFIARHGGWS